MNTIKQESLFNDLIDRAGSIKINGMWLCNLKNALGVIRNQMRILQGEQNPPAEDIGFQTEWIVEQTENMIDDDDFYRASQSAEIARTIKGHNIN